MPTSFLVGISFPIFRFPRRASDSSKRLRKNSTTKIKPQGVLIFSLAVLYIQNHYFPILFITRVRGRKKIATVTATQATWGTSV